MKQRLILCLLLLSSILSACKTNDSLASISNTCEESITLEDNQENIITENNTEQSNSLEEGVLQKDDFFNPMDSIILFDNRMQESNGIVDVHSYIMQEERYERTILTGDKFQIHFGLTNDDVLVSPDEVFTVDEYFYIGISDDFCWFTVSNVTNENGELFFQEFRLMPDDFRVADGIQKLYPGTDKQKMRISSDCYIAFDIYPADTVFGERPTDKQQIIDFRNNTDNNSIEDMQENWQNFSDTSLSTYGLSEETDGFILLLRPNNKNNWN